MEAEPRRFVLLDRDGVISRRIPRGHANWLEHIEFLPHALDALRLLRANQYAVVVIAREASARDRHHSASEAEAHARRMRLEVALSGGNIAQVYSCRHQEEDHCNCGKPAVGLIARARADFGFRMEETFFVGEYETSLRNAAAMGCRWIQIQREAFLQPLIAGNGAGAVASSLYGAVELILAAGKARDRQIENARTPIGNGNAMGRFGLTASR